MISTSEPSKKKEKNSSNSFLKRLLSGEFLSSKEARKWYCYFFFVFILLILIALNEHSVERKRSRIKELETEYKFTIGKLKKNNQFIMYEENKELVRKLNELGFEKNDKNCYKIVVNNKIEDDEE